MDHIIKIIIVLIIAWIVNRYVISFVKRALKKRILENSDKDGTRAATLVSILANIIKFVIWLIIILIILSEIGIDIGPILAGVGIVGLAFGMGAKKVIEDFLGGLFLVVEDQYRVGDLVRIGDVEGTVKKITLRRTIIKSDDGIVHSVPTNQGAKFIQKIEFFKLEFKINVCYSYSRFYYYDDFSC